MSLYCVQSIRLLSVDRKFTMISFKQILSVLRGFYLTTVLALTFGMFSRSIDYVTGNPRDGNAVVDVVTLEPPVLWGTVGLILVAIVSVGLAFRKLLVIAFGAVCSVVLYLTFAWINFVSVFGDGPPYDDWRNLTMHASTAVLWGAVAAVGVLIPSFEKVGRECSGVSTEPRK